MAASMLSVFIVICGYPNAMGSKIQSAAISDRVMNPPMISSMSLIVFVVSD
jgi:hypothetical protein